MISDDVVAPGDGPRRRDCIRVWFTNIAVIIFLLILVVVSPLFVGSAADQAGRAWRYAIAVSGESIVVIAIGILIIRTMRIGVYRRPEGIRIRGLFTTKGIPWRLITGTYIDSKMDLRGNTYYMPGLTVQNSQGETSEKVGLWWLSGPENGAEDRARALASMISEGQHPDSPSGLERRI